MLKQGSCGENYSRARGSWERDKYKKDEAKANRTLVDSIKDHLIPHVFALKTSKEVYGALVGLFENDNTNRKLALGHTL